MSAYCRWRVGSQPSEEHEHTKIFGSWWDTTASSQDVLNQVNLATTTVTSTIKEDNHKNLFGRLYMGQVICIEEI